MFETEAKPLIPFNFRPHFVVLGHLGRYVMTVKLNVADLEFILRQVKISEAHAGGTALTDIYVDTDGNVVAQGTAGAIQAISSPLLPSGLRTVDGTYNNLIPGRETWGAADTPMPRLLDPNFLNDADGDVMPLGPPGGPLVTNTDYGVIGAPSATNGGHTGNVADADPRIISNLVVDQSVSNPAAVAAWFANEAALSAFHDRYGVDAIPVRPGEGSVALAVANASFENQSLADGQPGVTSSPLGNYTVAAPTGWTISGGIGGLFAGHHRHRCSRASRPQRGVADWRRDACPNQWAIGSRCKL